MDTLRYCLFFSTLLKCVHLLFNIVDRLKPVPTIRSLPVKPVVPSHAWIFCTLVAPQTTAMVYMLRLSQ